MLPCCCSIKHVTHNFISITLLQPHEHKFIFSHSNVWGMNQMCDEFIFYSKQILEAVDCDNFFDLLLEKTKTLILPSYCSGVEKPKKDNPSSGRGASNVHQLLREILPNAVMQAPEDKVKLLQLK